MIIIINGAIGTGKTEAVNMIEENVKSIDKRKVVVIREDVSAIKDVNGFNMLKEFYDDKKRWSFTFEFYMFILRVKTINKVIEENGSDCIYIIERCWFADRVCFAETLYQQGYMNEAEWFTYNNIFNWLVDKKAVPEIDAYVFIECSLETHMKRIKLRGREEEKDISTDYEQSIIDKHIDMRKTTKIPFTVIDGEQNYVNDSIVAINVTNKIIDFIKSVL